MRGVPSGPELITHLEELGFFQKLQERWGGILSLDEQINYFQTTVATDLPKIFRTLTKILKHLSKSIFFVQFGANDYFNNYLAPADYNTSRLRTRLMRLYYMGARKFVVLNIVRFGCFPGVVNTVSPRPATPCAENLNNLVSQFNAMLPVVITTLERTLTGTAFVRGDFYSMNLTSTETAQLLGLPLVPPYLGLPEDEKSIITTGVNYASGGAGILPETGVAIVGDILCLDKQINYFQSTVTTDLPKIFSTPTEILRHLSKSIFFVSIGSNDYMINYLVPRIYNSSRLYTPRQFANLLIEALMSRLTRMYYLGARKFVILNLARIGCLPGVVSTVPPQPSTLCVEDYNNLALQFNVMLPNMTTTLENTLVGSTFVLGDFYSVFLTSDKTGFASQQIPCCEVDDIGYCLHDSVPCQNRKDYLYWDGYHPTEAAVRGMATDCFSGLVACVPINIQQLAKKEYEIETQELHQLLKLFELN